MGIGGWGFRHNPQSLNPHFSFHPQIKFSQKKMSATIKKLRKKPK